MSLGHKKSKEFFRKLHQKKAFRGLVYSSIVLGIPGFGFYAHFIEPRFVKISRLKIPIKNLPSSFNNFRIVHISDIHFGPTNKSLSFLKKCVQKINQLNPDIVVMTGDFMQWESSPYAKKLALALSEIKSQLGTYATLGNHDYGVCYQGYPPTDPVNYEEIIKEFQSHGIKVLHNDKVTFKQGNGQLELVGLGDYWTPYFKPKSVLSEKTSEEKQKYPPTILLSHNPDSLRALTSYHFDLMLSGHVHGGQVSFPFIGPLSVPVKDRHLRRGLHHIDDHWLYTNRGLGFIFKARFNSRPEIACLDLISS